MNEMHDPMEEPSHSPYLSIVAALVRGTYPGRKQYES